jgi:hypothetical protein
VIARFSKRHPKLKPIGFWGVIPVMEFSREGYKTRKIFGKKLTGVSQMKLLNFENWSRGKLSKIRHHFRK